MTHPGLLSPQCQHTAHPVNDKSVPLRCQRGSYTIWPEAASKLCTIGRRPAEELRSVPCTTWCVSLVQSRRLQHKSKPRWWGTEHHFLALRDKLEGFVRVMSPKQQHGGGGSRSEEEWRFAVPHFSRKSLVNHAINGISKGSVRIHTALLKGSEQRRTPPCHQQRPGRSAGPL